MKNLVEFSNYPNSLNFQKELSIQEDIKKKQKEKDIMTKEVSCFLCNYRVRIFYDKLLLHCFVYDGCCQSSS